MISEKSVAAEFHGLWSEVLPLLTPSFVRVFNEAHCENLTNIPFSKFEEITISREIEKYDLVAEFAFCAAELSHTQGRSIEVISLDEVWIKEIYKRAIQFLSRYRAYDSDAVLNEVEKREAYKLASQYQALFDYLHLRHSEIEFRPQIRGAGFLGGCAADISAGDTLYEIKTISRNLSGNDIRQLILYLALRSGSDDVQWDYAGFFNPRRALHYRFSVEHLIYRTSGGKSRKDVFDQIINFLGARGIEIDTPF